MYKLITFDANGTLLKLRCPVGQTYSLVAKNHGIILDSLKTEDGFKLSWRTMNEQYPNFGLGSIGWKSWWKNIVIQSLMKSNTNSSFNEKELEPVAEKLIDLYGSDEGWDLAAGCQETLQHLKTKQIKIGAISNFDIRLHNVLKSLKIYDYFDFVLTSYEVGIMKPAKEIFKMAEIKADIKFEDDSNNKFLHVGDNADFDYFGALNAGWDAALISKNKQKVIRSHPVLDQGKIFNNLFEFTEFIK